jgi:hypothetical protein
MQVLCHCLEIVLRVVNQQYDLPHSKAAALDVCLPACRRITKINERGLRAQQTLLNQPRAGVGEGPPLTVRHTL